MRQRVVSIAALAALVAAGGTVARAASAKDVGEVDGSPVRLDVTETSFVNYHFDNRNDRAAVQVDKRIDDNYGEWLNRFNVAAAWKSWQGGLRLDTATYFHRPDLANFKEGTERENADSYLAYRYRDTYGVEAEPCVGSGRRTCLLVPSKAYLTYAKPAIELTAGDSYVSFGRGLVLSIRKLDELAADTSVQGAKVVGRLKPITLTAVAGWANPVRIDEATGVSLRDADPAQLTPNGQPRGYSSVWSRDLIVGARAEAKVGTSTVGIHAADVHRRADLALGGDPTIVARDVLGAGASLAIPKISDGFPLNVYTEFAMQRRARFDDTSAAETKGYAAYSSLSMTSGIVTGTFEGKHYRSYYPVRLNADPSRFTAFRAVQYMAPPTVELVTQDSLFDNSCVTGGRARVDVKATKALNTFLSAAYFANWGERSPTECGVGPGLSITSPSGVDSSGRAFSSLRNDVWDGYVGFDLRSQSDGSYGLFMLGIRRDVAADTGNFFYREGWVQFDLVKTLDEMYSLELNGWHRNRFESDGSNAGLASSETWREGETYFAVKYTSKRSVYVGHEYTTRTANVKPGALLATDHVQHFLNVGAQFRFNDSVMLRLFVGQQRGALKCVSGVCRVFPAFEGAKSELVITY